MPDDARRPIGQLTTRELDLYGNQLTRCLKALAAEAPIRADVQRELAAVRAEQEARATPGEGHPSSRPRDVSGLTGSELDRTRRKLHAALALSRPGSPARTPILAFLAAIDAELASRFAQQT